FTGSRGGGKRSHRESSPAPGRRQTAVHRDLEMGRLSQPRNRRYARLQGTHHRTQGKADPNALGRGGCAMKEAQSSGSPASAAQLARRLDQLCDRFEAAWMAGRRPQLERYLGKLPPSMQLELLRELLV